ncbi:MAG: hypothetical protein ACI83D_000171 [Planctomycetota bacterium]|jgi:hypothetical protein
MSISAFSKKLCVLYTKLFFLDQIPDPRYYIAVT